MTQRIIEVDSQILNSIQNCQLKHELQFDEDLSLESKPAPLEKGDLLHKMMELYDGIMGKCHNINSDTWQILLEEYHVEKIISYEDKMPTEWMCTQCGQVYNCPDNKVAKCPNRFQYIEEFTKKLAPTKRDIIDFCIKAGQFYASKMQIDTETSDNVIFQFNAYCEFYSNDPWMTLAVEEVGSKILYEDENLKIIYSGKIDRLVQQGNIIAPMDHKSSERRGDVSSMSNQFIGYCFLLNTNHIIIDKIGFQKTLKPHERFQRFILNIDYGRIDEWAWNSINWLLWHLMTTIENEEEAFLYHRILRARRKQPMMNLTSCDKYSGCIYRQICEASPDSRSWIKERDYVKREKWDVGSILEAKK